MNETQNNDLKHLTEALAAAGVDIDASQLSQQAQDLIAKAKEDSKHLHEKAEAQIRDNPLATVGIVFLAGVVLGNLLGRR